MQLTDVLNEIGGVGAIARELGISESQAEAGAAALAPAILGGLKRNAQSQSNGLDGLLAALSQLGGSSMLDDVLRPQAANVAPGNEILGQIFGSRDVSRSVAQQASMSTGISPDLLKKMLPVVAMLVAGYMSRHAAQARLGATAPAGLAQASAAQPHGSLSDLLDLDGDGNPLDDILSMAGKLLS